jgi:hypothetical protein
MSKTFIITSKDISLAKKQAKSLSKKQNLSHNQALDAYAHTKGLKNWNDVLFHHSKTLPSETALKKGLVVAIDIKTSMDANPIHFIRDDLIPFLKSSELFEEYKQTIIFDSDDESMLGKTLEQAYTPSELNEDFVTYINNCVFYRLQEHYLTNSLSWIMHWIEEDFWGGVSVDFGWLNGSLMKDLGGVVYPEMRSNESTLPPVDVTNLRELKVSDW